MLENSLLAAHGCNKSKEIFKTGYIFKGTFCTGAFTFKKNMSNHIQ